MLDRYEPYLLSGLWHVHTARTDGEHTVEELVGFATAAEFPLLGIVEHVREELTYDFESLVSAATAAAAETDLTCVVGCEAKVLDTAGRLDASDETLAQSDVVYAAYHGTTFTRREYLESVHAMLSNPVVDVWAHPWAYARKRGFDIGAAERAAVYATLEDHGVRFEMNLRRPPTPTADPAELRDLPRIVGYDLHSLAAWPDLAE